MVLLLLALILDHDHSQTDLFSAGIDRLTMFLACADNSAKSQTEGTMSMQQDTSYESHLWEHHV
jgi:hypothetical protein